ncbi:MAG: NAD(P)/FAD-dependent oxidoreductase, partial [Gammaproteobacteria bacterium]
MATNQMYDIAIIGTGIGGSTLAAILARQGLKVIAFEGGTHPRFAVGESMILESSEAMRALAEFYDVPELAYFSSENYYNIVGTSHGVKRHFSFLHHQPGQRQDIGKSLQAVIPKLPYGHEMHIYRQDSDYLLTAIAISYGAEVLQATSVADVAIKPDEVEIKTAGRVYRAKYIVDAGGMKSLLAEKNGWRHRDLLAHSRTLFTHMVGVPCFNETGPSQKQYRFPFRLSEGTLHHVFKGGWLWVIPFNNHPRATNPLCSVGLQLDPRLYPVTDLTPEEEFYAFIKQYPDIEKQFANSRPVRSWVRNDRLQYSSRHVVGDRFALLGHAAGFIDPLYSKGLYVTHMSVMVAADLLLKAHETGDYSA